MARFLSSVALTKLTTAMKVLATISFAFIILMGTACKKEASKPKLDKIAGEYTIYRFEILTPYATEAWPNKEGIYGKFVITSPKPDSAIAFLQVFDKNNKQIYNDPWYCKVKQNADGEIILIEDDYLAAYIRPGYRLDWVGYTNEIYTASKK
jgi:hypothetical protein